MPGDASEPFQYALLRVVPDLERGETLNAGVVLFSRRHGFLDARVRLDRDRLAALAAGADADADAIEERLDELARVARGDPAGGPIAALDPSERFGWLTAPASTAVQPSAVHTGLCDDPASMLERLFERLVG
jgi:Protein of unknown function (DUF3037)